MWNILPQSKKLMCLLGLFHQYKEPNRKALSWHVEETKKCIWFKEQENKHGEEGSSIREIFFFFLILYWGIVNQGFPGSSDSKESACRQETRIRSLGWEDPLEKGMATRSSILTWRILWTEEPGGLQSMGSQRVGYDWATNTFTNGQWTMLW